MITKNSYLLNTDDECFNVGNGKGTVQAFYTKHPLRNIPKLTITNQTFIWWSTGWLIYGLTVDDGSAVARSAIDGIQQRNVAETVLHERSVFVFLCDL